MAALPVHDSIAPITVTEKTRRPDELSAEQPIARQVQLNEVVAGRLSDCIASLEAAIGPILTPGDAGSPVLSAADPSCPDDSALLATLRSHGAYLESLCERIVALQGRVQL